jgi:hypothetical protein
LYGLVYSSESQATLQGDPSAQGSHPNDATVVVWGGDHF